MAYHNQITHGIYLQHFSEQRVPSEMKIGPICMERNIVRLLFVCLLACLFILPDTDMSLQI